MPEQDDLMLGDLHDPLLAELDDGLKGLNDECAGDGLTFLPVGLCSGFISTDLNLEKKYSMGELW